MSDPLAAKRVLVTGATGFIGSHLVRALVARGDHVRCLVRRTSLLDGLRGVPTEIVLGDITQIDSLRAAVAGIDVVYHLAGCNKALRSAEFYRVNAEGPANLVKACAEQPSPPVTVLVSSLAAAGPALRERARRESDPPVQVSEYGRSKRAGEVAAGQYAGQVPISVVRPPIVFGGGDKATLEMFRSVANFGVHMVPGLARYRFSLIHAGDLAQLLILAAQRGKRLPPPESSNGAPGQGFYFAACETDPTYSDLGRMIAAALGRQRVLCLPLATPLVWMAATGAELLGQLLHRPLTVNLDKASEATAGSWICSPQAAIDELGFSVQAPLAQRLRQTAEWYRAAGWLDARPARDRCPRSDRCEKGRGDDVRRSG